MSFRDKIAEIENQIESFEAKAHEEIESFRISFLGSKGKVKELFKSFKEVSNAEKREFGQVLNQLKTKAQEKYDDLKTSFSSTEAKTAEIDDLSRPGYPVELGSRHPISLIRKEIVSIFERIGFTIANGPEIEDDWHNFSALNFPEEHPARDMQDTFFLTEEMALRTHTSSVQVRVMQNEKPPIRKLMPGRVFRNEAISARAHCVFHQIEGLYIDKDVSFADLKQTLYYFAQELFGPNTKIRLRPSYFPFTEPSAEMDVYWGLKNEVDYRITKGTGWLEIMGCGMVDPNVLKNNNINPNEYSGYAFGLGLERIALHKYQIPDLRYFYENDLRFLKQFTTSI